MAGPWLVDGNRFATKIRSASGPDPGQTKWKSNPSRTCPNCQCIIDNDDVAEEWPGLPRGVKFDPTDQEIIHHLLAKAGIDNMELHPFIDEFIPTVNEEDGICYTHPRNLPGVKQDGSAAHFFHRSIKAYNTGTRKRRKIHGDNLGDVRWHKTGRTKPVMLDGLQRGCKKIMVLYVSNAKGGKAEKTNWVMHQYHLGTEEDEKEGEFVISKVFHQQLQQQQLKQTNNNVESVSGVNDDVIVKVDPVTPKSVTPDPPRNERRQSSEPIKVSTSSLANAVGQDHSMQFAVEIRQPEMEAASIGYQTISENHINQARLTEPSTSSDEDPSKSENHIDQVIDHENNQDDGEEPKWWESESQYLIDSQQLVEGLSLCDDLLQSQSPNRNENDPARRNKPGLSDYALLGPDDLKKDLEECQNLVLDPANIDLDTPPDFRLSQLDFGSQESFLAWGGGKVVD